VGGDFEGGVRAEACCHLQVCRAQLRRKRQHDGLACSLILWRSRVFKGLPKMERFGVDKGKE